MNNLKGYTLVEVLIVMSLFSLISLLSLTFLNTSVSSSIGISSKSKLLNELAVFSELLEDDLFHVAKQFPRPSQIDQFPSFFKLSMSIFFTFSNCFTLIFSVALDILDEKPNFGTLICNGIWPPSNPGLMLPPDLDF